MINQTQVLEEAGKQVDVIGFITSLSSNVFLPAITFYWIFQFLIILMLGYIFVKKDRANFFSIFVFIQLIGAIILFFIFIYPVIPQLISEVFT